jgi:hypothetical protein
MTAISLIKQKNKEKEAWANRHSVEISTQQDGMGSLPSEEENDSS